MRLLIASIIVLAEVFGCNKQTTSHICKWDLCPFKGQESFTRGCGLCDQGTDCWALDSLHVVYPVLEYDELETVLFPLKH